MYDNDFTTTLIIMMLISQIAHHNSKSTTILCTHVHMLHPKQIKTQTCNRSVNYASSKDNNVVNISYFNQDKCLAYTGSLQAIFQYVRMYIVFKMFAVNSSPSISTVNMVI